MTSITPPKPMSGFPELLPAQQLVFNRCLEIVRRTFERHGFTPIETPAVERKEVLTAKGGNDKEIYALSRLAAGPGEDAETDYALHFDLTVPLARYVAQHKDKLVFPFRRYQIQKVWRGERPQAGRYRELYQCDIDVIGRGSVSLMADAELPSVIYHVFREMDIGHFVIRINNRRLLHGFLDLAGVPAARISDVLHIVDAWEKTGRSGVEQALINKIGLDESLVTRILSFLSSSQGKPVDHVLADLRQQVTEAGADQHDFGRGVQELQTVIEGVRSLGVPEEHFEIDLSIARGLDYYTGTVYETRLTAHPDLGSICSGGRYDDLAGYFTNEKLPGVGISIGLSRLVLRLLDAGVLKPGPSTPAIVLVTTMDQARLQDYLKIGAALREGGIATEVFLERARLGDQLRYASRKGFRFAVIAGEDEFTAGQVKLKDLATAIEQTIPRDQVVAWVKRAC